MLEAYCTTQLPTRPIFYFTLVTLTVRVAPPAAPLAVPSVAPSSVPFAARCSKRSELAPGRVSRWDSIWLRIWHFYQRPLRTFHHLDQIAQTLLDVVEGDGVDSKDRQGA